MSIGTVARALVVVDKRTLRVRVVHDSNVEVMTVTVTMDDSFEWIWRTAGWMPLSLGTSDGTVFLWSAREVAVLPWSVDGDPQVIEVDEDLLYVFGVDVGWLFVCEASIRRLVDDVETDRFDLGEVVQTARWDGGVLLVRDTAGEEFGIHVDGHQLVTQCPFSRGGPSQGATT